MGGDGRGGGGGPAAAFFGFLRSEATRLLLKLRASCWKQTNCLPFKRGHESGFWGRCNGALESTKKNCDAPTHPAFVLSFFEFFLALATEHIHFKFRYKETR
jgi:hypothetical protein